MSRPFQLLLPLPSSQTPRRDGSRGVSAPPPVAILTVAISKHTIAQVVFVEAAVVFVEAGRLDVENEHPCKFVLRLAIRHNATFYFQASQRTHAMVKRLNFQMSLSERAEQERYGAEQTKQIVSETTTTKAVRLNFARFNPHIYVLSAKKQFGRAERAMRVPERVHSSLGFPCHTHDSFMYILLASSAFPKRRPQNTQIELN